MLRKSSFLVELMDRHEEVDSGRKLSLIKFRFDY